MKNMSLVSICIPTYNNARYIGKTLESIIKQSYSNIEIIVNDNVCTDNTRSIVQSFDDYRIKYFINDVHLKTGQESFNMAISRAKGELIALYHSDDIYDKDIVFSEAEFLNNNPDYGAVFVMGDKIDEDGNFIGDIYFPRKFRKGGAVRFYDIFMTLLQYGYAPLICPSVMFRKSVFEALGGFDIKIFGTATDTEMWFRICEKFPIGIIGKRLIHVRITNTQGTKRYNYLRTAEADIFNVIRAYINSSCFTSKQRVNLQKWQNYQEGVDNIYRSLAFCLKREYSSALELVKKSLNFDFLFKSIRTLRGIKYLGMSLILYLFIKLKFNNICFKIVSRIYKYRWT